MSTSKNRLLINSIGLSDKKMFIELNNERILKVPYSYTPKLKNATQSQLKSYRLIANGIGIHFDKIDEDISLEGIIRDFGSEVKRINISVQANFLNIADKYAKENHLSRSALFQKATLDYMAS